MKVVCMAQTQLEIFGYYRKLLIHELNFICLLQLCQNDVQFQIMNLNFGANFVILNKRLEHLNTYLLE